MVRRCIGSLEDLTVERFRALTELDAYDGPEGLRRLLGRLVHLSLAGPLTGLLLKNFVMLDTFAVKRPRA
ncbi:MAG: hypothetical protein O7A65_01010 [Proteobacteria bacterium]|nr:hypothetical protein [Pseudomonadota bacterium]